MYKLLGSIFVFLCSIFIFQTGVADENKFYVQFNAGAAFAPSYSTKNNYCYPGYGCNGDTSKQSYDTGFAASIALGYRIAEQFRLELEGLYQSNDNGKYSFNSYSPGYNFSYSDKINGERERSAFLLNGYYDFKNSSAFTPFITAGLGGYHLRLKTNGQSLENDLDFAWQAGAGVNYKLDDQISFDLKYRYFGGTDAALTTNYYFGSYNNLRSVGDHQIMAGIRIGF